MNPQVKTTEQDVDETAVERDLFVRQVDDDSLPAREVLTDQREGLAPDEAAPLFVP